jgi:hypothetical protein
MKNTLLKNEPLSNRVLVVDHSGVDYGFNELGPSFFFRCPHSEYPYSEHNLDPSPGHPHDQTLVTKLAEQIEAAFPIAPLPYYLLLSHETKSRTNGHVGKIYLRNEAGDRPSYVPVIVLIGKRTPLHPAMTRYLVAHEYGHCVDDFICDQKEAGKSDLLDKEYASLRGIKVGKSYGPLSWPSDVGEIIANDFRICVTGLEEEFWPHLVAHPLDVPAVREFWKDMRSIYASDNHPKSEV